MKTTETIISWLIYNKEIITVLLHIGNFMTTKKENKTVPTDKK